MRRQDLRRRPTEDDGAEPLILRVLVHLDLGTTRGLNIAHGSTSFTKQPPDPLLLHTHLHAASRASSNRVLPERNARSSGKVEIRGTFASCRPSLLQGRLYAVTGIVHLICVTSQHDRTIVQMLRGLVNLDGGAGLLLNLLHQATFLPQQPADPTLFDLQRLCTAFAGALGFVDGGFDGQPSSQALFVRANQLHDTVALVLRLLVHGHLATARLFDLADGTAALPEQPANIALLHLHLLACYDGRVGRRVQQAGKRGRGSIPCRGLQKGIHVVDGLKDVVIPALDVDAAIP
mmetsp:Transcript_11367/g.26174  ORF Transcript_11367/g.26174 Transcript_11367/m.26174 type:complete len:291 (-) Transcript_11367:283-1155(-)